MIQKAEINAAQSLRLVSEKLDMFMGQVSNDALRVLISDSCQTLLGGEYSFDQPDAKQQYAMYRLMQAMITSIDNYAMTYDSMILYDQSGRAFASDDMVQYPDYLAQHQVTVLDFLHSSNIEMWTSLHKSPLGYKSKTDTKDCFSYLHKVYDMLSGQLIGILELNVSNDSIVSLYEALLSQNYEVIIMDDNGRIISSHNKAELYQSLSQEKWYLDLRPSENLANVKLAQANNRLYIEWDYQPLHGKILSIIPSNIYMYDVRQFSIFTLVVAAALLIVATRIAWRLIRSITRPISVVTKTIVAIGGGDYQQRILEDYAGEIGTLALEINRMTEKTSNLMLLIKDSEQKKREYELSLIQLQMAPHFFYNTLESICGLILMDEKRTAIQTIHYLSDFYRGVLNKGQDIIEIGEEITIAKNYLNIMAICHPGLFNYEVHCPPYLKRWHVNKLTLQPILENALHHGMEGMKSDGMITIDVYEENGEIVIRVTDNGTGIPAETMEKVASGGYMTNKMDGFGLRNTDDRIKLYFGADYGISIQSQSGQGTMVSIILPKQ